MKQGGQSRECRSRVVRVGGAEAGQLQHQAVSKLTK